MYGAVEAVIDANPVAVNSIRAMEPRVQAFRDKLAVIRAGLDIGAANLTGVTEDKSQALERAGSECFALSNALWSVADDANDEVLKAMFPSAITSFQQGKAVELLGLFKAVLKAGREHADSLGNFGFDGSALDVVEAAINDFQQKINSPKLARSAGSNRLNQYIEEFNNMDAVIDRLDHAVNALRNTQSVFYAAYTKSRYLGTTPPKKDKEEVMPTERTLPVPPPPAKRTATPENGLIMGGSGFDRPVPKM